MSRQFPASIIFKAWLSLFVVIGADLPGIAFASTRVQTFGEKLHVAICAECRSKFFHAGTRLIASFQRVFRQNKHCVEHVSRFRCLFDSAIKTLKSLHRPALTKGYIIDVMLGNIYFANQDLEKAKQSMISALTRNPLLTGLYRDLGMILISSYDTPAAWECFNVARKLKPHHPQLVAVFDTQKKLEHDFPDLF